MGVCNGSLAGIPDGSASGVPMGHSLCSDGGSSDELCWGSLEGALMSSYQGSRGRGRR